MGGAFFAIGAPCRHNALNLRCLQRFGLRNRDRGRRLAPVVEPRGVVQAQALPPGQRHRCGCENAEAPAEPRADGLVTPDAADVQCGGPTPPWIPAERATRTTVERPDEDRRGGRQARPAEPETGNPNARSADCADGHRQTRIRADRPRWEMRRAGQLGHLPGARGPRRWMAFRGTITLSFRVACSLSVRSSNCHVKA